MTAPIRLLLALAVLVAAAGCGGKGQSQASPSPVASAASAVGSAAPVAAPTAAPSATATPNPLAAVQFTDVKGIYAEPAIRELAVLGVVGTTAGRFDPYGTLTRAEYVRWLVLANNAYFKNAPDKQIRLAEADSEQSFVDVPKSSPDFTYVQGMANSGFVIGIDKTHFAPDRPLTREEMIAILNSREMNGATPAPDYGKAPPTQMTDGSKVSKPYWGAINYDFGQPGYNPGFGNINRVFGSTKEFHPLKLATRAEAATALQVINGTNAGTVLGIQ